MNRGFSVIELLVVTAIIAILAAVLFPVFASAPSASETSCLGNLRRLIYGAHMYAIDHNDHVMPWVSNTVNTAPSARLWVGRMAQYVPIPTDPATKAPVYPPPDGPYRCPEWTEFKLLEGADRADCDGVASSGNGGIPYPIGTDVAGRQELISTYGMAFPMCSPAEATTKSACVAKGGTIPSAADYGLDGSSSAKAMVAYPGDKVLNNPAQTYVGRTLSQVVRLGQTAFVADGATYKVPTGNMTLYICEGQRMHYWGGNFAMLDGSATFIKGNAATYTMVGTDGKWIEKYFTFYE